MNFKYQIKKIFTVIGCCLLAGSGLALLVAAINSKNSSLCNGMEVEINGGTKAMFLGKKDVAAMLENDGLKEIRNRKTSSVDLLKMETVLRKNNWIKDVQIYFDNNQTLKVKILERQPIARIFTTAGSSYLIDSSYIQMAVPEKTVFRLPVFTGYPEERFGLRKDSALYHQVKNIALFLNSDPFWSIQIQEVDIRPYNMFMMTPLIGNQIIEFGDGNDYENKFHKLYVFYKEVIAKTGFEKYTGIKLAFANQVVATRKQGIISKADSIQARKNVLEMIRLSQKMQSDTAKIREVKPLEKNTITEQNLHGYDLPEETENNTEINNKQQKQQN